MSSSDEWISEAYENAKLFKEKVKRWHDKRILKREFNIVIKYYCIGLVSDFLQENYSLNGRDHLLWKKFISPVLSRLIISKAPIQKL